jgi:hypothetical protein
MDQIKMKPAARACRAIPSNGENIELHAVSSNQRESFMTGEACVVPFSYGRRYFYHLERAAGPDRLGVVAGAA